ncbi:hypothetical protein MJ575_21530 [Klebsiella pneumoniae]|nr:hypothetical protein MJ575_21530 [Klebsiella pneumoniae]
MAFFGGTTGAIYRQFSITIVAAMVLPGAGGHDPHPCPLRHAKLSLLSQVNPMKEKASSAGSTGTFNRSASRYETFVGKILQLPLRAGC